MHSKVSGNGARKTIGINTKPNHSNGVRLQYNGFNASLHVNKFEILKGYRTDWRVIPVSVNRVHWWAHDKRAKCSGTSLLSVTYTDVNLLRLAGSVRVSDCLGNVVI